MTATPFAIIAADPTCPPAVAEAIAEHSRLSRLSVEAQQERTALVNSTQDAQRKDADAEQAAFVAGTKSPGPKHATALAAKISQAEARSAAGARAVAAARAVVLDAIAAHSADWLVAIDARRAEQREALSALVSAAVEVVSDLDHLRTVAAVVADPDDARATAKAGRPRYVSLPVPEVTRSTSGALLGQATAADALEAVRNYA